MIASKKQKDAPLAAEAQGQDTTKSVGLSDRPSLRERTLDKSVPVHPRPNIDSRISRPRVGNPQSRSARLSNRNHVPSKHPEAPTQRLNSLKLSSQGQVAPTATNPPNGRAVSKIGFPASRHRRIENVPPRPQSGERKVSEPQTVPRPNLSQHTAKSIASPSAVPETNAEKNDLPSEGIRQLQAKLLQLHILHSASADIHQQWRESAKQHFQKQFDELVERHAEISDIAYQTQELKNRSALVDWCRNVQAPEVARRARTLSRCIQEIYENLDPGGKYSQVVGSFEAWFARARSVQESRNNNSSNRFTESDYVEEIGAGWQNDVDALQRRLSTLTGDLRTLGSASTDSTLGQLLVILQDLVIDMLAEVDCIRSIEYEIIGQEEVWMEAQIKSLSSKVHNEMGSPRKTPRKRRDDG
ncbi:MAG: hypothetical protein LQ346_001532 [Caloplaca aetnensis]|nr:MAG: hypothetical protein LQ346_001532 [Caloplaca aetnensis]